MLDHYMLEALDRTLRDLMRIPDKPFGDKIFILAGDFRQCTSGNDRQVSSQNLILWQSNFFELKMKYIEATYPLSRYLVSDPTFPF